MSDPAAIRALTSQLTKIRIGLKGATHAVERTLLDIEALDLTALSPATPRRTSKRKREHPVRCDLRTIERRGEVLEEYRRFKTGESLALGWEAGNKQPWSYDAITDTLALLLNKPKLDARRIFDWKGGQMAQGKTAQSIERALLREIDRMRAAKIMPTAI